MTGATDRDRALARVIAEQVDYDVVEADLVALGAEVALRNAEAPVELADRLAGVLGYVPATVLDAAGWARGVASALVGDGLVPVGARGPERAVAATAGWIAVGAAVGSAPSVLASVLSIPSAPRTVMRVLAAGVGPYGRRVGDDHLCSAPYRSGGTLVIGVPGSGKTELLTWLAACSSGPVVISTPLPGDVAKMAVRATDHPCLVFDPANLLRGHAPPGARIVTIDLLDHVTDWATAGQIAANIVNAADEPGRGVNEAFWRTSSQMALRTRLFAASHRRGRRGTVNDVQAWLAGRSAEVEVMRILAGAGDRAADDAFAAEMGIDDERTRSNILSSARADLEPFASISANGERLDLDRFVAGTATLVLLADPLHAAAFLPAVGLLTRLVIEARFELFHQGRAGTPMLVLADEVVRMPAVGGALGELLAVGSSRSVNIVAAAQATRQLDALPGGAEEMLTAAGRTIFFPGSMSEQILRLGPFLDHDPTSVETPGDGDTIHRHDSPGFDPSRLARPAPGTVTVLEHGVLTGVVPYAAHEQPLWRLAALDAAFGRTGI